MFRKILAGVGIAAGVMGVSGPAAFAATADIVFIVDESGSMGGEHTFLDDLIPDLDAALLGAGAGITSNNFAVVGFGASNPAPRTVSDFSDATSTVNDINGTGGLVISGATEDGYAGMTYALNNLTYTGDAVNFILVTDEDRDTLSAYSSVTFQSMLAALTGADVVLNAIVNATLRDDAGGSALGIDSDGESYVADGSGGFTTSAGANCVGGSGSTCNDYVSLALQTGGAAWDLNQLRAGGLLATSFASALIDIKVKEIQDQITPTNPIPLPAAGWLLLAGVGGLAAASRRKKAA